MDKEKELSITKEEKELYDKAEKLAEAALCNVKCLCPEWKEGCGCCQCDVFYSLREYYIEQLQEKKETKLKLKDLKTGAVFNYKGYEFTKLADEEESCYCLLNQSVFESNFGETNDWAKSPIRQQLNEFDDKGESKAISRICEDDLVSVELNYSSYKNPNGRSTDKITLLSLDEYWAYDFASIDSYAWLRSGLPNTANNAYILNSSGSYISNYVTNTSAVRPALHLKDNIEVEIEE